MPPRDRDPGRTLTNSMKPARKPAKNKRAGSRLFALGLGAVVLFLTACQGGPQNTLNPAGIFARRADNLFEKVFIVVVVVFVLVEGAIVYFMIRYRERPGDPAPVQIHGHTRAEAIWTIIPAVILAGVAI